MIERATCDRHLARDARALRANAGGLGLEVQTVAADAEALPFEDESFDLVLGHAVLHHLPDLDTAFSAVCVCLVLWSLFLCRRRSTDPAVP